MKHEPKHIPEGINTQKTNEWFELILMIVSLAVLIVLLYFGLNHLISKNIHRISIARQESLFNKIKLQNSTSIKKNPFLQELAHSLNELIEKPHFHIEITEWCTDQSNALALPGGQIVVFSPLLKQARSINEIQMVLAHELGHLYLRHHLQNLGRSSLMILFNAVFQMPVLSVSNHLLEMQFSQTQETLADEFAAQLVVKNQGHAGGITDFFSRLGQGHDDPMFGRWLKTHPSSHKRVEDLNQLIDQKRWQIKKVTRLPDQSSVCDLKTGFGNEVK